jgi:hypothetical protein
VKKVTLVLAKIKAVKNVIIHVALVSNKILVNFVTRRPKESLSLKAFVYVKTDTMKNSLIRPNVTNVIQGVLFVITKTSVQ